MCQGMVKVFHENPLLSLLIIVIIIVIVIIIIIIIVIVIIIIIIIIVDNTGRPGSSPWIFLFLWARLYR